VVSIGDGVFEGCYDLTEISVAAGNPDYASDSLGVLFNKTETTLIEAPANITSYTIPTSVTSIGDYAFSECFSLMNINIPSSVTSIGDHAFDGCTALTSVNISLGVASIGVEVFSGCVALPSISIPSSMTSIGQQAFWDCWALTNIIMDGSTPPSLPVTSEAFDKVATGFRIHVPSSAAVAAYDAATGWSSYSSEIVTP